MANDFRVIFQGANEAAVEAEERPVEPVGPEGNI